MSDGLKNTVVVTSVPETIAIPTDQGETSPATASTGVGTQAAGTLDSTPVVVVETRRPQINNSASPVIEIPLTGPVANRDSELSGLAWYRDYLILLPQFPDHDTGEGDGFIYALPKADVITYLDGQINHPLEPRRIPFVAPGLSDSVEGFEGYEAIAFLRDGAYVTIEAKSDDGMLGYLAKGTISPDLSALQLDTSTLAPIAPQAKLENMSEESVFVTNQLVGTIYEVNGAEINSSPVVHLFDLDLTPLGTTDFPNVDYRITDASQPDQDGRFWAINYFFPGTGGAFTVPGISVSGDNSDQTWLPNKGLGRLIEFRFAPSGITRTGATPIQLESLLTDIHNWEGLVRLDDRGFLIVSDEFPGTVLGFVPLPNAE